MDGSVVVPDLEIIFKLKSLSPNHSIKSYKYEPEIELPQKTTVGYFSLPLP